jgi:hypothetical protein
MPDELITDPTNHPAISVTEAAHRLGVSERTVYRRLQAGKLHRANMSDNRQTHVITQNDSSSHGMPNPSDTAPKVSDIMSDITTETLKHELEEKNRQIAALMENQREMVQTIQQMQQQLQELSAWILAQKSDRKTETESTPTTYAKVDSPQNDPQSGWLANFLKRGSKTLHRK